MEPEREGVTAPVSTFNHRKRLLLNFLSATFISFSLCSTNQEKKHPSNHSTTQLLLKFTVQFSKSSSENKGHGQKQTSHSHFIHATINPTFN